MKKLGIVVLLLAALSIGAAAEGIWNPALVIPPQNVFTSEMAVHEGLDLVAMSIDQDILLYNTTGQPRGQLRGHAMAVSALDFSPDGRFLASGGSDGNVILWDTANWEPQHFFQHTRGFGIGITGLDFRDDSEVLASSGFMDGVRLWDVNDGVMMDWLVQRPLPRQGLSIEDVEMHSDRVAVQASNYVNIWRDNGEFFNLTDQNLGSPTALAFRDNGDLAVAFADGIQVYATDYQPYAENFNGLIGSLQFETLQYLGSSLIATNGNDIVLFNDFFDQNPDGQINAGPYDAVAIGETGKVYWVRNGALHFEDFNIAPPQPVELAIGRTNAVAANATHLVSAHEDGFVRIWDPLNGVVQLAYGNDGQPFPGDGVRAVDVSGSLIASGDRLGNLYLFDTATGAASNLGGHLNTVDDIALSPDGSMGASVDDEEVLIWDTNPGAINDVILIDPANSSEAVVWLDDERIVYSDNNALIVYNTTTQMNESVHSDHFDNILSLAMSSDMMTMASSSITETYLWDVANMTSTAVFGVGGSHGLALGPQLAVGESFNSDVFIRDDLGQISSASSAGIAFDLAWSPTGDLAVAGQDGFHILTRDGDNDRIRDGIDDCPTVEGYSYYITTGCVDSDSDGYDDLIDVQPNDDRSGPDRDGDGQGDVPFFDPDWLGGDHFPDEPTQWADSDGDGWGDNWGNPAWNGTRQSAGQFIDGANQSDQMPYNEDQWFDGDFDGLGDNPDGRDGDPSPWDRDNDRISDEWETANGSDINTPDGMYGNPIYIGFSTDPDPPNPEGPTKVIIQFVDGGDARIGNITVRFSADLIADRAVGSFAPEGRVHEEREYPFDSDIEGMEPPVLSTYEENGQPIEVRPDPSRSLWANWSAYSFEVEQLTVGERVTLSMKIIVEYANGTGPMEVEYEQQFKIESSVKFEAFTFEGVIAVLGGALIGILLAVVLLPGMIKTCEFIEISGRGLVVTPIVKGRADFKDVLPKPWKVQLVYASGVAGLTIFAIELMVNPRVFSQFAFFISMALLLPVLVMPFFYLFLRYARRQEKDHDSVKRQKKLRRISIITLMAGTFLIAVSRGNPIVTIGALPFLILAFTYMVWTSVRVASKLFHQVPLLMLGAGIAVAVWLAVTQPDQQSLYLIPFIIVFLLMPMFLYGNIMGSSWNFLVYNFVNMGFRGKDYLSGQNVKSKFGRAFGMIEIVVIGIMPLLAINAVYAVVDALAFNGLRDPTEILNHLQQGGFMGEAAVFVIQSWGEGIYIDIFSRFAAALIVLGVSITGVSMVRRVVQLQMLGANDYFGRWGFDIEKAETIRQDAEARAEVIEFAYYVFYGYAIFLVLAGVYSEFASVMPELPFVSAIALTAFVLMINLFTNVIFFIFWALSLSKLWQVAWRKFTLEEDLQRSEVVQRKVSEVAEEEGEKKKDDPEDEVLRFSDMVMDAAQGGAKAAAELAKEAMKEIKNLEDEL